MKIVREMYGNAYKSACLKLFFGGVLCTIIVRNGVVVISCSEAVGDGGCVRLRCGTEGSGGCAITVRNGGQWGAMRLRCGTGVEEGFTIMVRNEA